MSPERGVLVCANTDDQEVEAESKYPGGEGEYDPRYEALAVENHNEGDYGACQAEPAWNRAGAEMVEAAVVNTPAMIRAASRTESVRGGRRPTRPSQRASELLPLVALSTRPVVIANDARKRATKRIPLPRKTVGDVAVDRCCCRA
jgi:hypothetical protein